MPLKHEGIRYFQNLGEALDMLKTDMALILDGRKPKGKGKVSIRHTARMDGHRFFVDTYVVLDVEV